MSNDVKSNTPQTQTAAKPAETKPAAEKISMDAEAFQKALEAALTKGIAEGMAMATMAATKNQPQLPQSRADRAKAKVKLTCTACLQDKRACKEKHREAVVFPKNRRWARYFRGVCLNGVWYRSENGNHKITIPASSEVEYLVAQWERNEEETIMGREVQNDSGVLSGKGRSNVKKQPRFFR